MASNSNIPFEKRAARWIGHSLLLALVVLASGCPGSGSKPRSEPRSTWGRSVTLTAEDGEARAFNCAGSSVDVTDDDMKFFSPYVQEVMDNADVMGDAATKVELHNAVAHGDVDRVATIVLRYKCNSPSR